MALLSRQKGRKFVSIKGITERGGWHTIVPDDDNDWLNQVDPDFDRFMVLGEKKDKIAAPMFKNFSLGVATGRDAWCYNASKDVVKRNIHSMIEFYNAERERFQKYPVQAKPEVGTFINNDPTKISWTHRTEKRFEEKNKSLRIC